MGNSTILPCEHLIIFLSFWGFVYLTPNQNEWWREASIEGEQIEIEHKEEFSEIRGWPGKMGGCRLSGHAPGCLTWVWHASDGLLPRIREMHKMNSQNLFYPKNSPVNSLNKRLGCMGGVCQAVRHGDDEWQKEKTILLQQWNLLKILRQALDIGE